MNSGKARSPILSIIGIIRALPVMLPVILIVGALGLQSCRQIGLPASEGLPTSVPAPALVPTQDPAVVPTQDPALVPTAAPPLVPTVAPPQPTTAPPAPPAAQPAVIIPDVAPVPQGGAVSGDSTGATTIQTDPGTSIDSVEPYPVEPGSGGVGSGSSSRSSSASASSRSSRSGSVRCGVRVRHIVRPGQNLFRIALRYRTTIHAIARLNGIPNVRLIRSGQRLTIVTCR